MLSLSPESKVDTWPLTPTSRVVHHVVTQGQSQWTDIYIMHWLVASSFSLGKSYSLRCEREHAHLTFAGFRYSHTDSYRYLMIFTVMKILFDDFHKWTHTKRAAASGTWEYAFQFLGALRAVSNIFDLSGTALEILWVGSTLPIYQRVGRLSM